MSTDEDAILQLRTSYLQSVPAIKIPFDNLFSSVEADWDFQTRLYNTVLRKDATAYHPAGLYRRQFLKSMIESLQKKIGDDGEIYDDILILYSALLSQPESLDDITKPTYTTYLLPSTDGFTYEGDPQIVVSERRSLLSANGHTGSRTWEAALALGEYFLSSASPVKSFRNHTVLELGAGTAFTSILLSKLQAKHVLATDGSEFVCEAIRTNITLNKCANNISVSQLFWGTSQEDSFIYSDLWDIIIGGDITYDSRDLSDLVFTLKKLLKNNVERGAYAIISATVRNEDTIEEFESHLKTAELGFSMNEINSDLRRLWYYGSDTAIRIYTIRLGVY
ncbi:hypothetical protein TWF694_009741 [Orbilia ellipsospora]|uniref:Uncharacterized protein n=1 Tax=Orbilia ellipsospora TaxID=2528407 RepID=A0AAV9XBR7_9PEZI